MRDDFSNDVEEFMDLCPAYQDKKFSGVIWNGKILPLCRRLVKLRKVNRLRAGFDSSKGKEYYVTVWTSKGYESGGVFTVRFLPGNTISVTCRDLMTNELTEGGSWDWLVNKVADLKDSGRKLEHLR